MFDIFHWEQLKQLEAMTPLTPRPDSGALPPFLAKKITFLM